MDFTSSSPGFASHSRALLSTPLPRDDQSEVAPGASRTPARARVYAGLSELRSQASQQQPAAEARPLAARHAVQLSAPGADSDESAAPAATQASLPLAMQMDLDRVGQTPVPVQRRYGSEAKVSEGLSNLREVPRQAPARHGASARVHEGLSGLRAQPQSDAQPGPAHAAAAAAVPAHPDQASA